MYEPEEHRVTGLWSHQ